LLRGLNALRRQKGIKMRHFVMTEEDEEGVGEEKENETADLRM
jgi:hypothetical protein